MAESYSRNFPEGTKRITTGCQYCAVGCGYNAFLIPENATGSKPIGGVSRFITPAMRNRVRFKGEEHEVAVAPDVRCDLNKGNHSVRGGSQGENLVTYNRKGRSTEDRLKSPMVRLKNGQLKEISWATLNQLLAGLVKEAAGMEWNAAAGKVNVTKPEAVGAKVFEYQYLENTYAFTKLFYSALGTPNVAYHDRPSAAGSSPGMGDAGLSPHDWAYEEVLDTDVLVFVGTNPYENQSVFFMQHAVGKKMVVIDPRETATARYATETGGLHVQLPKLGIDSLILYGVAREILVRWKSENENSLANYPWKNLAYTNDDELSTKGDRRQSRAMTFKEFSEEFLEVDNPDSPYALDKIVDTYFSGDTAILQSLQDFVSAIYPDKLGEGEDEHFRRVGLIYEKGMIWGFNYHNTAAVASLGLLLGAGDEPGRFVGRVGGHQKGWAESLANLNDSFEYPNSDSAYAGGYPSHNSTDSYSDPQLTDLKTKHNLDNHVFGPPEAMNPAPSGTEFVKLDNGLRTRKDPEVELLFIIGGNYFGQTNDAQVKRELLMERLKLGGPSNAIHRPNEAQAEDGAALLEIYAARMNAGGLVVVHQDIFENPTSSLCDILIPAAGWGEDDFCRYNAQRRLKLYGRFQDPPLHGGDQQRIKGAATEDAAKPDPALYWDLEKEGNAEIYQHSPKPDWMIFRDLGRAVLRSVLPDDLKEEWCENLFSWKNSADVADEMAIFSNRGLAKGASMLGDLFLFGQHAEGLAPGSGILHEMLGAGNEEALAPRLNSTNYKVTGIDGSVSASGIYGNQIASNGVLLPVRGIDDTNQEVDVPVEITGGSVDDALAAASARGQKIKKLHGTLRVRKSGPFNFVKAGWDEIRPVFEAINDRGADELFITNGRFNHLWNNMFHHLRNEYSNERYPEDMPGTILEVNPIWAAAKGIGNGDVVKVSDGNNQLKAIASLQDSVPENGAFAMFSYPVRKNGKFNFDGFVNNLSHGYADGINPIGALKYGKAKVTKVGTTPYQSATRQGPTYEQRNQIQKPPQRDLDLAMRELIVKKGLPRAFVHTLNPDRAKTFLSPDELFEGLKTDGAFRNHFLGFLPTMKQTESAPSGELLIDHWSPAEIDLAHDWAASLNTAPPPQPPSTMTRFEQVIEILDNAVGGADVTVFVHGAFWRNVTRDQFVELEVLGQKLITLNDGAESTLVKALKGEFPFGRNDGVPNAPFNRMPSGPPAVAQEEIAIIEKWIDEGCPDTPIAPGLPEISDIYLYPPLVIGRLGSSGSDGGATYPDVMDNYDVTPDQDDVAAFRNLSPAETLVVDTTTGEITSAEAPAEVSFRGDDNLIRPVAPFLELWAKFDEEEPRPLTVGDLEDRGLSTSAIKWFVRVANLKAYRRTGDPGDRITANAELTGHGLKRLSGGAANFLTDRHIHFGWAQYIKPTDAFPEIRMRFTPAAGKVFGHRQDFPEIEVVYDSNRGQWDNYIDSSPPVNSPTPRARMTTVPAFIYARQESPPSENVSLGYLDDACDGIVEAELSFEDGRTLKASARVSSAPPDFAPDSFHVRTVADEMEQLIFGPEAEDELSEEELAQRVIDTLNRAVETVRLLDPVFGNARWFTPWGNNPPGYFRVTGRHAGLRRALEGLKSPPGSAERDAAVGQLRVIFAFLRRHDQVGDYSNTNLRRMPALMRGADGRNLALTRRQRNLVERAIDVLGGTVANTPEAAMLRLIGSLGSSVATLHTAFQADGGPALSERFATPPEVLEYLLATDVQGNIAADLSISGPLVVPGEPDESAFVTIISNPSHPMHFPFQSYIDQEANQNGIDVVRTWISSL